MVLISYSHDSPEHEARVLEFANRLRRDGVDAVLDQYESFPPMGWIRWIDEQVERAKFVLLVLTEGYGAGRGSTYEGQLIQQLLYNTGGLNEKFIPVVLTEE